MTNVNSVQNEANFKNNTVKNISKNTFIAGSLGAGIGSLAEYSEQRNIIKNGKKQTDAFVSSSTTKDICSKIIETKSLSKQGIFMSGFFGAAIVGGIYLLSKGIKTYFSQK